MKKNDDLKILTVAADKGGVRKTTTTHNYAEWLALEGHSVLLIDEDRSMNLTRRYILGETPGHTQNIIGLYEGLSIKDGFTPIQVKKNIDLISSSTEIPQLEKQLEARIQRELVLFKWIAKNYQELNSKYDYILIDTRNDNGVLTLNALAAADVVIGITDTSVDGYEALDTLKSKVEELNEAYENNAHLVFVAGGIVKKEIATKEILKQLSPRPEFIGSFRKNTNMANPETMFAQAERSKRFSREQEDALKELTQLFTKIKGVLDGNK